ncbi:hypothetical protein D3C85_1344120 [compost metagenome]
MINATSQDPCGGCVSCFAAVAAWKYALPSSISFCRDGATVIFSAPGPASAAVIVAGSTPTKWRRKNLPMSASRLSKQTSRSSRQSFHFALAVLGELLALSVRR